jgi:hypothetical protein
MGLTQSGGTFKRGAMVRNDGFKVAGYCEF